MAEVTNKHKMLVGKPADERSIGESKHRKEDMK
jgi:hypothetical protein